MKTLLLLLAVSLHAQAARTLPDIPPDAPTSMYRTHLGARLLQSAADGLDGIVKLGERNIAWLNHMNSLRPADQKISLTSKATQNGIPIDKPSKYNPTLIQKKLEDLRPSIPASMQRVIWDNAPFTDSPPEELDVYTKAARELDRVYQSALRWRTMAPWLSYLAGNRHNDVRGWYFLSRLEGRAEKLANFSRQDEAFRTQARDWLVGMCFNADNDDSLDGCNRTVDTMISRGADLEAYYQSKQGESAFIYNGYFRIPNGVARPEGRFEDGTHPRMVAPFQDPGTDDVRHFLQDNIQDEWKFGNWHLELPFQTSSALPHVEFEPGVTPHVNRLGGDTITMNSVQPLTEYDAQWTIRHEYGHVLGFPDCYVEFYIEEERAIMNYQFDIENLMCSRRGHIQERHVSELKRAYTH